MLTTPAVLDRRDAAVAAALGSLLRAEGFPQLLASYGSDELRTPTIAFDLPLIPEPLRTLVRLFHLGDELSVSEVEAVLPGTLPDGLQRLGLLQSQGNGVSTGRLRLVNHFGVLVFCEKETLSPVAYYGNDSLALGRVLQQARGRVLDLCAGVGTQGLLCALTADSVVAVEMQREIAPLFLFNAALNQVSDRVELRFGDLTEPVAGESFDFICCNPPLLPVPPGVPYPLVGDGGGDGLEIVMRIVNRLKDLLRPGGQACLIGTMLGNWDGPDTSPLERAAEEHGLDILMVLPARERLSAGSRMLEALVATSCRFGSLDVREVRSAYLAHFAARNAEFLYSFLMLVRHAGGGRPASVRFTRHYLRNKSFWTL